jgi:peroxiredoxin
MLKTTLLISLAQLSFQFVVGQNSNLILQKSLDALNNVGSASFYYTESVAPSMDTLKVKTYRRFYREFINPDDRTIGSTFAWFHESDTAKMEFFYNGQAKGYVDRQNKSIAIDSFFNNLKPFRPVGPPFFNYTKSIIRYALDTKDSISVRISEKDDSFVFRLIVYDQVVEFFGNNLYYTDLNVLPYIIDPDNIRSEYTIWIRKSDYLPFGFKRKMPHNVSFGEYAVGEISREKRMFDPLKYFPPDFTIKSQTQKEKLQQLEQKLLLNKIAPAFSLKDQAGKTLNLQATKEKVVVLYFTGVGCGPCHASLPFLKKLVEQFSGDEVKILGFESWKTTGEAIKKYAIANDLNFSIVPAEPKMLNDYAIASVPTFFILDKKRIIKKILTGYTKSATDSAMTNLVIKLLEE